MKFPWIRMSLSWLYMQLLQEKKPAARRGQHSVRLVLEPLEDRLAPAAFTVTLAGDNNGQPILGAQPDTGSLRAAIVAVNKGQVNTINFNINGPLLVATAPLPPITNPVTIDGSTAPGGNVVIEPDAANLPPEISNGLTFGAGSDGSQVLGLTIDNFKKGDGIRLNNVPDVLIGAKVDPQNSRNLIYAPVVVYQDKVGIEISGTKAKQNTIYGSYIGTNTNSVSELGNSNDGILIDDGANNNTIGGLLAQQINVISSNGSGNTGDLAGVAIESANKNTVAGDYIGTDSKGADALGNVGAGVYIAGQSTGNKIGVPVKLNAAGAPMAPANLISGGNAYGVEINGMSATGNIVEGNWIGVNSTGNVALPNSGPGVYLVDTTGNTIGGAVPTAKMPLDGLNVISGNKGKGRAFTADGILVAGNSTSNKILNNNIGTGTGTTPQTRVAVPNFGDGIFYGSNTKDNIAKGNRIFFNKLNSIEDDGKNKAVDPNLSGDNGFGIYTGTEAGAPVLTSAVVSGNTIAITGTLSSTASSSFTLEFFGNTNLDASGNAEGEFYLGNTIVTTDNNGNASFQVTLNSIYGNYVTATATNMAANGGTSQFSSYVTATGESQSAAVGGNVWNDANANGLPDSGEIGVGSVNVQLFTATGILIASTNTDANGNYLFTNVTPGEYYLQFTEPSGYFFTPPYQGDATVASHVNPTTGDTEQFSLLASEVDPYYNAGLIADSLQEPTTTTLNTTSNSSYSGYQVTFTATVAQTDAVPLGGNVTFMDGTTTLGTVALTSDSGGYQASFTTSSLSVGDHTITANYTGDGFHTASSATLTQTVQPPLSVTSLSSSANPDLPGQAVTFTASVTGNGTPTGSVTFYDGSTALGTVALDANDNAAFTTSTLASGINNISAVYSGDSNFGTSTGTLTQLISQETSSSMSLSSSLNPALQDQAVTFTATVGGGSGTPTGTVTFTDGDILLGTATVDGNGNAAFTTSDLLPDSQTITATYSGDGTYNGNSASLTQTVNSPLSFTSLSSNATPALSGAALTFTANVSPLDSTSTPTGTVTFYDGSTQLGTVTLDANGNAAFTTSTLALGSNNIIADYSGDSNFDSSIGTLSQVISWSFAKLRE